MTKAQELRDQLAEHLRVGDIAMRKRQSRRDQRDRSRRRCGGDFAVSDEMHMYSGQCLSAGASQVVVAEGETLMHGYGQIAEEEWALARKLSQDAYRLEDEEPLDEIAA